MLTLDIRGTFLLFPLAACDQDMSATKDILRAISLRRTFCEEHSVKSTRRGSWFFVGLSLDMILRSYVTTTFIMANMISGSWRG